jgi:hypothetical protein
MERAEAREAGVWRSSLERSVISGRGGGRGEGRGE